MRKTYKEYELIVEFESKKDLEKFVKAPNSWAERFLDVYDSDDPKDAKAAIIREFSDESPEDFEFNKIEKIEKKFGLNVVDSYCDGTGYCETWEE